MTKVRKRHNAEFKSKVAVEAIKEHKTINELTAEYGVHATQISNWKKQALTVSIRPFPIVGIARHEVAAHQYPYLYGLAAV